MIALSGALGTTTAIWEAQVAAFDDAVAFDHPGHGQEPLPLGDIRVETIAPRLLQRLPERFSFVGLSLGGMIGMWIAANAPERVERLVLACTGASLGTPEVYNDRAALVRKEGTGVTVDGTRERWFTPAFRNSPAARRIINDLIATSALGYAACAEAVGAFDFRDRLGEITTPTLVLYGEHDPVTPPEVIDTLARAIPGVQVKAIANAAHLANVEQPGAFNDALRSHL